MTLEEKLKLIFTWFVEWLQKKIEYYKGRPDLVKLDIINFLRKSKYKIEEYFDPPPPQTVSETNNEYFDRIDPKYGLRFYKFLKEGNINRDIETGIEYINANYEKARDRKVLKKLLLLVNRIERENVENYERYLIRSKIFNKNQN